MERGRAIELVRKLKRLAASEQELGHTAAAASASLKVAELVKRHHITRAELSEIPTQASAATLKPPSVDPRPVNLNVAGTQVTWDNNSVTINGVHLTQDDLIEMGGKVLAHNIGDWTGQLLRSLLG